MIFCVNRPEMSEVPAIWCERLGLITETVILKQIDVDSPFMKHCTLRYENTYNESSI